jgi:hypothetical protein
MSDMIRETLYGNHAQALEIPAAHEVHLGDLRHAVQSVFPARLFRVRPAP